MEEKWICQTFWSKPIKNKRVFKIYLKIAAISLHYAHHCGYKVRMHTDDKAFPILSQLQYDDIKLTLNKIPNDAKNLFFAQGKYYALKEEPLNSIHIDFDVFIKKPILDDFYNDKSNEFIFQCREFDVNKILYNRFDHVIRSNENFPDYLDINMDELNNAINVGVIGFNNQELKDEFINKYFKFLNDDHIQNMDWEGMMPDLLIEQIELFQLTKDKKGIFLLPDSRLYCEDSTIEVNKNADEIGYQHLRGNWKDSNWGGYAIDAFLKKLNPKYHIIINEYNYKG